MYCRTTFATLLFAIGPVETALGQWPPAISYPEPLNSCAATDGPGPTDDWEWAPWLTTDGTGTWVGVWDSKDDLDGTIGSDYDILIRRSTDEGANWTPEQALNSNAATGGGGNCCTATDGNGNWVAVWPAALGGEFGTDVDIVVSQSTDNGTTWTDRSPLNNNAASDSNDDMHPRIATDGTGNWIAAWMTEPDLPGDQEEDLLIARSTDNGATWATPIPLNTNAASDTGGDYLAVLAPDGLGNWVAVWYSDEQYIGEPPGNDIGTDCDILFSCSTDNGVTWTEPSVLNTNAASDTGEDKHPWVATDSAGNWVTVWWSSDDLSGTVGTDEDILFSRSIDNGTTWTSPAPLNTYAGTDSGYDGYPRVVVEGLDNWLTVWGSTYNLGGTIGTDTDLLLANSTNNGLTWGTPIVLNTNATADSGGDQGSRLACDNDGHCVVIWLSSDTLGGTIGEDLDVLVARLDFGPQEAIPTVSEWGMIAMTLLGLTAGTLLYARRCGRRVTD
ncbi:MAG: exo-alpha-sialidase [Phycisphaerales bacterium]|nr:MAG: exo-alpha-sialidase [Phycisphaerales bacterium]